MLQALVKKGKVISDNVPAPAVSCGSLLIKVVNSCISAGTEISGINSSGKSIIKKALEQPDKIVKAFNMLKAEGFLKVYEKMKGAPDFGSPTGYSISGIVIAVGAGVTNFQVGDRVAAAGAGIANHAEYVDVPVNLVMRMPQDMRFEDASSVALGGIALQGVRRADLKLGEFGVVIGAGILGLLTVQMLKLSGIRVAATDLDENRLKIASELGADLVINPKHDDPVKAIENWSGGFGADAVIFTAATGSNEPLSQSFKMCKRRGRVILVGVSGTQIKREDMYNKELDFLISTSYGPGRYDKNYEEKGLEYPYSYIRWTENRNMSEYLRLIHNGLINLEKIINAVLPIESASEAFAMLQNNDPKPLMVLLDYGAIDTGRIQEYINHDRKVTTRPGVSNGKIINVALIGAGGFATGVHLPNIKKLSGKYKLHAVLDKIGHNAKSVASQYDASYSTTNFDDIINDPNVDLVLIATRHDSHAELSLQALKAGKNVFVEKPLATNTENLNKIKEFYLDKSISFKPILMVGFNRRFSKYAEEIKKYTDKRNNPLFIQYTMNAGYIPQDHWVHEHGGRIIGECCHIIDLMTFFTRSRITSISLESLSPANDKFSQSDNKSIVLKYSDGSICNINYFATGSKEFPKEQMMVNFDEKTIHLDDYKSIKGYGIKINEISTPFCEKGQFEELEILYETIKGNKATWPIELWDMFQTTETSFLLN